MKKFNKKQLEAIDTLKWNIDELDNKPKRLFNALREFAIAFLDIKKEDEQKETLESTIKKINEFERLYYTQISLPEMASDIVQCRMDTDNEVIDVLPEKTDFERGTAHGARKATMVYCQKMLKRLAEYYD